MILGSDKTRLSKRHGATSVIAYREMGYLPEALVNYLVRLGWSYGDQEVFSPDELTGYFSFEHVGKSAAVFNPEKLLWLNSQYIMSKTPEELAELVMPFLISEKVVAEGYSQDKQWLEKAVLSLRERAKTLVELANSLRYYLTEEIEYNEKAKAKFLNSTTLEHLKGISEALATLEIFIASEIEKIFVSYAELHSLKLGMIAQPVRVAMTGRTESPGIFEVLEILGKTKTLRRLESAIKTIEEGS
jgi:glutamyl-tRNA synthetase